MRIRLNRPADLLARHDEAILLYPGEVIRLSGVSAEIVRLLCSDSVPIEDLADALEARFGTPEHVSLSDAVTATVTELAGRGVLTVE